VYATDASEDALAVARENALRLGAYNVALRAGDLYAAAPPSLRFDVITANPPYIARGEMATLMQDVRDFEPRLALEAGDDGLDVLRRVVAGAPAHLVAGGVLAVEVGAGQAPAVAELFRGAGFDSIELRRDYARIERVVSGVLPSL
jgi:release factor glutamine methyltransferase